LSENNNINDLYLQRHLLKKKLVQQKLTKLREHCLGSYYSFFVTFWDVTNSEELSDNWHIKYLCDELEIVARRVVTREIKLYDLIINQPPGTTKSNLVSISLLPWIWLLDPSIIQIANSYASELSINHSIKARSIVQSDIYKQMFGEHFKNKFGKDFYLIKENEKHWTNNFGGGRIATSTGGSITGIHAHMITNDDPLNVKQAASEAQRKTANDHGNKTLSSRKIDKENTPTITVMQRLHEDDPTGNLLGKAKKIKHICLPAEVSKHVKPAELKDRYTNGLLDEKRLNRNALSEAKVDLGSYGYAGQYQQTPSPDEGGKLKRNWFEIITESELPQNLINELWIDGAYTKDNQNDPTGMDVFASTENDLYWIFSSNKHMELPDLLKHVPILADQFNIGHRSMIHIEPKASGKSLKQMLKDATGLNVKEIKTPFVGISKVERVDTISPKCEAGRVKLLKGPWNEEVLDQLCTFPNAKHDEQVDNLCYAVEEKLLTKKKRGIRRRN